MSTIREQIILAIKAQLVSVAGVDDTHIYRTRTQAITKGGLPAIVIEPDSDSPLQNVVPFLDWKLKLKILIFARGDEPDALADPILNSVHSKIMADLSVGGLAMHIEPDAVDWEFIDGDKSLVALTCRYVILYRTAEKNLSSQTA